MAEWIGCRWEQPLMQANRSRRAAGILVLMHEFGCRRAEEALHRGIVPAICLAAHRLGDGGWVMAAVCGIWRKSTLCVNGCHLW